MVASVCATRLWRRWIVKTHRWSVASGTLLVLGGLLFAATIAPRQSAGAVAPCVAHGNTDEEMNFLALLQTWRNEHITGSLALTVSAPLNASAAGYARYLANTPGTAGHYADGSDWVVRASQCGYSSNGSGSAGGEGLAVVESGSVVSVSPQGALDIMSAHGGSGITIPANVGLPVKCVGVAKVSSPDGRKVAWVTVLFAVSGTCPQSVAGGGGNPTPTATATSTSTAGSTPTTTRTPSPSPSVTATRPPSPTPSPTATKPADPRPFKAVIVQLANDATASDDLSVTPIGGTTATPTPTPTATATPTPTVPLVCGGTRATITALDKLGERVTVSGTGDMTGWFLISEGGNQRFDFPSGFMLSGAVQIVSGRNPFAATATSLWWVTSTVWSNTTDDDALLYDCTGKLVMRFDDGM